MNFRKIMPDSINLYELVNVLRYLWLYIDYLNHNNLYKPGSCKQFDLTFSITNEALQKLLKLALKNNEGSFLSCQFIKVVLDESRACRLFAMSIVLRG